MIDLRLLIIAADPLVRAGLTTLLDNPLQNRPLLDGPSPEDPPVERQLGMRIVGQIGIAKTTASEIELFQPDVALWDLGWDPEESLTLLEELELGDLGGNLAVVALVPDEDSAPVAWSAGVRGLLYREVSAERLSAAIEAVYWGLVTIEPEFMYLLAPAGRMAEPLMAEDMTPRELDVLRLLAEGLSNKAIAQHLDISDHTVKFHVNAIMSKLGAQSRTAAVVQATRLGLIEL